MQDIETALQTVLPTAWASAAYAAQGGGHSGQYHVPGAAGTYGAGAEYVVDGNGNAYVDNSYGGGGGGGANSGAGGGYYSAEQQYQQEEQYDQDEEDDLDDYDPDE